MNEENKTGLRSSFVPKDFIWKETLQKSRLLWVSWSSCRRWVGWPAGWTDCRSPATHKTNTGLSTWHKKVPGQKNVRASEKQAPPNTRSCSSCTTHIFYINLRQNWELKNCSCRTLNRSNKHLCTDDTSNEGNSQLYAEGSSYLQPLWSCHQYTSSITVD